MNDHEKLNYFFRCESMILNFSSQFCAWKWVKFCTDYYYRKGWKCWEKSPTWLYCRACVRVLTCVHIVSTSWFEWFAIGWLTLPWRESRVCVCFIHYLSCQIRNFQWGHCCEQKAGGPKPSQLLLWSSSENIVVHTSFTTGKITVQIYCKTEWCLVRKERRLNFRYVRQFIAKTWPFWYHCSRNRCETRKCYTLKLIGK